MIVPDELFVRELTDEEDARFSNNFTYHPPFGTQPKRYEMIRTLLRLLASNIARMCPPSRELSLALTKLEEVSFWANAAIARNEKHG